MAIVGKSCFAALASLVVARAALAAGGGELTVSYVQGEATATPPGGAPGPLAEGAVLQEGAQIRTGRTGRVEIELGTGSLLRIGGRSQVELHSAPDASSFTARLSFGNLWAKVQKLLRGQRFQIETQNGVAGVRGTEFRVAASARGLGVVRVYEGAVEVKGLAGWTNLVRPGLEVRYSKSTVIGPRQFEAGAERSAFMRWVRQRSEERGAHGSDRKLHRAPEHQHERGKHR